MLEQKAKLSYSCFSEGGTGVAHVTHTEIAKSPKNGFVAHRFARFFAEFVCYAQDFFPFTVAALCHLTRTIAASNYVKFTSLMFFAINIISYIISWNV